MYRTMSTITEYDATTKITRDQRTEDDEDFLLLLPEQYANTIESLEKSLKELDHFHSGDCDETESDLSIAYSSNDDDCTECSDDDPESGENELASMMDSLVAELQADMMNSVVLQLQTEIEHLEMQTNNTETVTKGAPLDQSQQQVTEQKNPTSGGDKEHITHVSDYTKRIVVSEETNNSTSANKAKGELASKKSILDDVHTFGHYLAAFTDPDNSQQSETVEAESLTSEPKLSTQSCTNLNERHANEKRSLTLPTRPEFSKILGALVDDFSLRCKRQESSSLDDKFFQKIPDFEQNTPSNIRWEQVKIPSSNDPDYAPIMDYTDHDHQTKHQTSLGLEVVVGNQHAASVSCTGRDVPNHHIEAIAKFALLKRTKYRKENKRRTSSKKNKKNKKVEASVEKTTELPDFCNVPSARNNLRVHASRHKNDEVIKALAETKLWNWICEQAIG